MPHADGESDRRRRHPGRSGDACQTGLGEKWRVGKTAGTPGRVDHMADMPLGSMDALSPGGAHERVVVQRGDDRNAAGLSQRRQFECQVQQAVHVHDVGLNRLEYVSNLLAHRRRAIGVLERHAFPVVDELDDRKALVHAPRDLPMLPMRIVFGAQDIDMVPGRQGAAQLERVDFRTRVVARQKVMNRVKNVEALGRNSHRVVKYRPRCDPMVPTQMAFLQCQTTSAAISWNIRTLR